MTSELMLEILKSLQGQLALLRDDMGSIKGRLTSVDARMDAAASDRGAGVGSHRCHGSPAVP
jgi:hypothetical protein